MKLCGINNVNFTAHKISKERANYLENEFKKANKIDIITHESTDKDAANSALVLSDYLEQLGVQTRIIVSQKGIENLGLKSENHKFYQAKSFDMKNADALVLVDFSATDRIPQVLNDYLDDVDKVYCFDHHSNPNIGETKGIDYTLIKKVNAKSDPIIDKALRCGYEPNPLTPIYVDTSAKSASGIIYRYLEALNKDLTSIQAYNLFQGFVDDTQKRGLVICNGEKGEVVGTSKLIEDKNSYEIFNALKSKLTDEQVASVAKSIDIMSSLTKEEIKFKNSLYNRLQYSPKGHIAYVEIAPNDLQWLHLGMDNARTSTILNRFRQNVLNNDFNDPKLDKIKTVITFYRANDVYRMSLHSKEESLLDFFKYVQDRKIPYLTKNSGGHQSRAGGKIESINKYDCHAWVKGIISCDDFYEHTRY